MNMKIAQRTAQDEYHAQLVAQGMENAGADVFSITSDVRGIIQVFCKYPAAISTDGIDQAINAEVTSKATYYAAK